MPSYTIREVIGQPNAWSSQKGGPMLSYSLDVTGDDGFTGQVELNQKDSTPAPTVGQVIDGTLDKSNPKYAPKLKKAPPQGGGFGGGGPRAGKSKADQDSIERAVAYKGAIELACATPPMDDTKARNSAEQMEALVSRFFSFSLILLQGETPTSGAGRIEDNYVTTPNLLQGSTVPSPTEHRADVKEIIKDAFPDAEEVAPTNQELAEGYKEFMARQPGKVEGERVLETKKTALGIAGPVKDATPTQKRELLDWFKENLHD